jgi:hypothetical protein
MSPASCQIPLGLGKFCPYAVSFVPPAIRSQRHDGSLSCVLVEFIVLAMICNLFLGSILDFTPRGAIENCIVAPYWFCTYNRVFILSSMFG